MNNTYEAKDRSRIIGILTRASKSAGVGRARQLKQIQLAQAMAKSILEPDKARRRACAATDLGYNDIAAVFYVRYGQLTN